MLPSSGSEGSHQHYPDFRAAAASERDAQVNGEACGTLTEFAAVGRYPVP
jgi:hypothetical protein